MAHAEFVKQRTAGMVSPRREGCQPSPLDFRAFRAVKDKMLVAEPEEDALSLRCIGARGITVSCGEAANREMFRIAEQLCGVV
jgi:hypothetical protein